MIVINQQRETRLASQNLGQKDICWLNQKQTINGTLKPFGLTDQGQTIPAYKRKEIIKMLSPENYIATQELSSNGLEKIRKEMLLGKRVKAKDLSYLTSEVIFHSVGQVEWFLNKYFYKRINSDYESFSINKRVLLIGSNYEVGNHKQFNILINMMSDFEITKKEKLELLKYFMNGNSAIYRNFEGNETAEDLFTRKVSGEYKFDEKEDMRLIGYLLFGNKDRIVDLFINSFREAYMEGKDSEEYAKGLLDLHNRIQKHGRRFDKYYFNKVENRCLNNMPEAQDFLKLRDYVQV